MTTPRSLWCVLRHLLSLDREYCYRESASLPRSHFLDVTQRSPKRTAADIRTTFLFPNLPITARVPFLGTFSRQTRCIQSDVVFYRDPHVEKYHKQHKTNGGARRSFSQSVVKVQNFPSLMLTRSLQLLKHFNCTTWHHEVPHLCYDNCAADCECGLPDCGAFAYYPSAQGKENNGASIKKRQVDAEQSN